jgi:hypothetical protein
MGLIKENHPVGYYIENGRKPNRHTRVVGFIYGREDGRYRVSGLADEQLKTVYTMPARHGRDMETDASSLCYTLKDFVLGKRRKGSTNRGAPEIEFGKTSSRRKEVETHFQKPVRELFERKGRLTVLTRETSRLVFDAEITGGKYNTIAKQLKLKQRRESSVELGDALMGSKKAGMFLKMLLSIGPFSTQQTPGKQMSEGFGSLDPKFRDGVKTKPRRGKGWTEKGLLNPKASMKAGAIGPRACSDSCECFLCITPKGMHEGELEGQFNELLKVSGAARYNAPVLIPVRSREEVEPMGFGERGTRDYDLDARQVEMQHTIAAYATSLNDIYPMWMEADSWPAKNGFTLGLNLISQPLPEGYSGKPGHDANNDKTVDFVEIVAYPTHLGAESGDE